MKTASLWWKWLLILGVLITAFGVYMALFNGTSLFKLFDEQINPVFWGSAVPSQGSGNFKHWVYGTWGATIVGWGIFILYIVLFPLKSRKPWAWKCMFSGILAWFVLDTAISLWHRVYFNAGFNALIFLLAIIPLVAIKSEFGNK